MAQDRSEMPFTLRRRTVTAKDMATGSASEKASRR